jgi:hypothetical protein
METKWSLLVSYGMTVKALKDFLLVDEKLNAATIRNHTMAIAQYCEAEMEEERVFFIDGCPLQREALPPPDGYLTVGIDGGYLRNWQDKKKNFEVIVGKSILTGDGSKCFELVQAYDRRPKRRLFELLLSHGIQMNQEVYFMSDGEETVCQLQWYLNSNAKHILKWFHITTRLIVLGQFMKGLSKLDLVIAKYVEDDLESTKWNLWHGKEVSLDRLANIGSCVRKEWD